RFAQGDEVGGNPWLRFDARRRRRARAAGKTVSRREGQRTQADAPRAVEETQPLQLLHPPPSRPGGQVSQQGSRPRTPRDAAAERKARTPVFHDGWLGALCRAVRL